MHLPPPLPPPPPPLPPSLAPPPSSPACLLSDAAIATAASAVVAAATPTVTAAAVSASLAAAHTHPAAPPPCRRCHHPWSPPPPLPTATPHRRSLRTASPPPPPQPQPPSPPVPCLPASRPRGGKDRRKRASRSGGRSLSIGWARGGSLGRLRLRGDREGACCWCCAPCGGRAPRERSTDARRFRLFFAFSVHAGVDWRTLPCFPCDELSPPYWCTWPGAATSKWHIKFYFVLTLHVCRMTCGSRPTST